MKPVFTSVLLPVIALQAFVLCSICQAQQFPANQAQTFPRTARAQTQQNGQPTQFPRNGQTLEQFPGQAAPANGGAQPTGAAPLGPHPQAQRVQAPARVAMMQQPFPPLAPAHVKYLDQILKFWEFKSQKINHYQCEFQRWEYDPVFGPRVDPKTGTAPHKTFSKGIIKYASPDKGLFRVQRIWHHTPGKAGEAAKYIERKNQYGEHWVCDGKSIFEFEERNKQLVENKLPPAMQGKAIVDGPLPFLFGAKADVIKARYWVRVVTPPGVKGEYWLEAWPKRRADAANFKKLTIMIDEKEFLPKALEVYNPNYDKRTNPAKTVIMFENRQINAFTNQIAQLNPFMRSFFNPATPAGWKRIVRDLSKQGAPQPQGPSRVATPQGTSATTPGRSSIR